MKEVILYPTETIYGLGVNAFDADALSLLAEIKGRPVTQAVSCLVRNTADIEHFAQVSDTARKLMVAFLPGPLTIILPCTDERLQHMSTDGTVSFRVSPDPVAQQAIKAFMDQCDAPMTCTSANHHGDTPVDTPAAILEQLGEQAMHVTQVIDDGARSGVPSTVVRCVDDSVEIVRVGAIAADDIYAAVAL
jgi:L-threonylcarbamoyladenylate synthase